MSLFHFRCISHSTSHMKYLQDWTPLGLTILKVWLQVLHWNLAVVGFFEGWNFTVRGQEGPESMCGYRCCMVEKWPSYCIYQWVGSSFSWVTALIVYHQSADNSNVSIVKWHSSYSRWIGRREGGRKGDKRLTAPSSARCVEAQCSDAGWRCMQHVSWTPVSISPLQFIILICKPHYFAYFWCSKVVAHQSGCSSGGALSASCSDVPHNARFFLRCIIDIIVIVCVP